MRIQTAVVRTSQLRREFFLSIGTRAGGLLDRTEVERMAEFLIIQDSSPVQLAVQRSRRDIGDIGAIDAPIFVSP
ncbi:MAG: hypothetical protein DMG50_23095 [Acidobacteria bacterium]|nr:MAG: hypothetical protein DMG50_23095 [Acidobacteriota bacterium]